jgi:hypothetical protein
VTKINHDIFSKEQIDNSFITIKEARKRRTIKRSDKFKEALSEAGKALDKDLRHSRFCWGPDNPPIFIKGNKKERTPEEQAEAEEMVRQSNEWMRKHNVKTD